MKTAYQLGYDACYNGYKMDKNPYAKNSTKYYQWLNGWLDMSNTPSDLDGDYEFDEMDYDMGLTQG